MQSATNTAQAETWEQRQEREGRERLAWFNDKMKNVAALLGAYTSEPWAWQEPIELRLPLDAALELLAQARPAGKEA